MELWSPYGSDLRCANSRHAETGKVITMAPSLTTTPTRRSTTAWHAPRLRLAAIGAAAAFVLGGSVAYTHLQPAVPVSAQTILRQATLALSSPSPSDVVHETSTLYLGPGQSEGTDRQRLLTGPDTMLLQQWAQLRSTGITRRQMTIGTSATGSLIFKALQSGRSLRVYSAVDNSLESVSVPKGQAVTWTTNPLTSADPRALIQAALHGGAPRVRLLPQQTVLGHHVYVVELTYDDQMSYRIVHQTGQAVG